jgi:hypothetical protein
MHRTIAWIPWLSGLALLSAGCSGGSSGSGAFYVETCSLGCSNGQGGGQVSCGVVNAAENQDLAMLFSGPVAIGSVSKQSFKIVDVVTGLVPAGTFLIDPLNPNRLIFRPKLSFDPQGNPSFGFEKDSSYKIQINGTTQGDPPPFIQNTTGRENEARVLCTISTSGVVDPIPGPPSVEIQVQREDPITGDIETVTLTEGQVPGSTNNVLSNSDITFHFDELMNIGTLLVPSTGKAPHILVSLDTDGDLNTIVDRSPIDGTYTFAIDIPTQTTTLLFDPADGFPSAGSNPALPRLVVIEVPAAVTDIAGTSVGNGGIYNFAPQAFVFQPRTLPEGGEDFSSDEHRDPARSGANWGTAVAGQLTPGEGGGSGRLGDLRVQSGDDVVLVTSPVSASGTAQYVLNPIDGDTFEVAGEIFTFRVFVTLPNDLPIQANLPWTIASMVDALNAFAASNPSSGVAGCSFEQIDLGTLRITAVDPGPEGNEVTMSISPPGGALLSGATLSGGKDGETFSSPNAITNFDFVAQPGVDPPPILVDDGTLEFAFVDIEPNSTLTFVGENAARMLVRGDIELQAQGTINVAGESQGAHASLTPYGQPGGKAGPAAGQGGRGGDRNNSTDSGLQSVGGVTIANSVLDGSHAEGIGGLPVNPAEPPGNGRGGQVWPINFPTASFGAFADLAVEQTPDLLCPSHQVAGSGSGGSYATGGVRGVARTDLPTGFLFAGTEVCNLRPGGAPPPTGCPPFHVTSATALDPDLLEPPSLNPTQQRLLTPALGYLRGGSGGGGGGTSLFGTAVFGLTTCFDLGMTIFSDNSAGGGGGGGGALQVQVGDQADLDGVIDARGGQGGTADTNPPNGVNAAPGGGGSGGAILIEAGSLDLAATPARLAIPGGSGGAGPVNSLGGAGGTGLVRVEQRGSAPSQTAVALAIDPLDPLDPLSTKWLSVGTWSYNNSPTSTTTEEGFSGSQSCWLQVPDDAFSLTYKSDPANAAPDEMGWNMEVILDLGNVGDPQPYPFRGKDGLGPYSGLYPEEAWGQLLNRELLPGEDPAPVVVRFQGAKSVDEIPDLCDLDPENPLSGVQVGSLTPWVPAPTDLNSFFPLSDMVRWVIIFDRTAPFAGQVKGVTNLRIEVQPE